MTAVARQTLISTQDDVWLDQIRGIVTDDVTIDPMAGDRERLGAAARVLAARGALDATLDLIGHATNRDPRDLHTGPGSCSFLTLGDWILDDSDDTAKTFAGLRDDLVRGNVKRVRFLGCLTAATTRGWAALENIAKALPGVAVIGTRRALYTDDFGKDGCVLGPNELHSTTDGAPDLSTPVDPGLRTSGEYPALTRFDSSVLAQVATPLPSNGWSIVSLDVMAGRDLWMMVDPAAAVVPPIARPIEELAVPAAEGFAHRVEVLLDWKLVRVFPTDAPAGVCYAVRSPDALHQLIARAC